MKSAILCPGPSLCDTWEDDFEGLTIGVNRAAIRFPVDVWACGDWPCYEQHSKSVIGSPRLLIAQDGERHIFDHGIPWRGNIETFESMFSFLGPFYGGTRWTFVTATAAIVYAAFRGSEEIHLFGSDLSGTKDFDGVEAGNNRSSERWKEEGRIINRVSEVLVERRITIIKHTKE